MSKRFSNVLAVLRKLKNENQDSAVQREVDLAVQMILGQRPNIEQKYDELLLKLDRSYTQLEDVRDHMEVIQTTHVQWSIRKNAKIRKKCINKMLQSLDWMRARNSDLIRAVNKNGSIQETSEAALPPEVSEQAD